MLSKLDWKYTIEKKIFERMEICPICDNIMEHLQTCHLRCMNCGAELTCDEKGTTW